MTSIKSTFADEVLLNKRQVGKRVHMQVLVVSQDEDDIRTIRPYLCWAQDILIGLACGGDERGDDKERKRAEDFHIYLVKSNNEETCALMLVHKRFAAII
jgi:hypothetical protein